MFSIRLAVPGDIDPIYGFDQVAQREGSRRDVITRSIGTGACWVIVIAEQVVGYAVLEYSFLSRALFPCSISIPTIGGVAQAYD